LRFDASVDVPGISAGLLALGGLSVYINPEKIILLRVFDFYNPSYPSAEVERIYKMKWFIDGIEPLKGVLNDRGVSLEKIFSISEGI